MDILSDLLQLLRLRGQLYGQLKLGAPFALSFPREIGHFFIILDGRCLLRIGDTEPIPMVAGDFAFLPSDENSCLLSSDLQTGPHPRPFSEDEGKSYLDDRQIVVEGDFASGAQLVSGCFHFLPHEAGLLSDLFGGPLVTRADGRDGSTFMASIFQMVAEEIKSSRTGALTVLDRLAEILLIHALRLRFEAPRTDGPRWFNALRDPRLGRVLRALHFEPGADWSVARMANLAGMSRSGFARQFHEAVGRPPMEHLSWWRMQKAAIALTNEPALPINQLVAHLGYASEAAFRRKFVEVIGVSPSQYRQSVQTERPPNFRP